MPGSARVRSLIGALRRTLGHHQMVANAPPGPLASQGSGLRPLVFVIGARAASLYATLSGALPLDPPV